MSSVTIGVTTVFHQAQTQVNMQQQYQQLSLLALCLLSAIALSAQNISANYFQGDTLLALSQSGSAPSVTTFTIDEACEQLKIEITDPINAPQGTSKPYLVRVRNADGDQVTDLTDRLTVTMRARSAGEVPVEFLFRSGDGTSDFRTGRRGIVIPAGLGAWTEMSVTFDSTDFGPSFDPSDIRDFWFYLDRSNDNFIGNEFYIDHIVIGGTPDPAQNSPCMLGGNTAQSYVNYFQANTLSSFNTSNAAGSRTTFAYDTDCETLTLSVTDPVGDPLPPFNAFQVNLTDESGDGITNITGNLNVTMRVRSAEAVNVGILLRSGGGTMEERTERLAVDIPGSLEEWTQFTVEFTEADLAGFNPADLRDIWFYLDRGEANFAGNFFAIDHIAVGIQPDAAQDSPCSLVSVPTEFAAQFDNLDELGLLGGPEAERLLVGITTCEEAFVVVRDSINAPFGAFRPIVITPTDASGIPITNIEGQTDVFIRARSLTEFPISVLFRSGDGSTDFRTAAVSQTVEGNLAGWSNLTFTFTEEDLSGFDPTDLVDMWVYLDRENDNFPGNELYIDYIAIGSQPDSADNSPCNLPDLISGTNETAWAGGMSLYPNPTGGLLTVEMPQLTGTASRIDTRLLDLTGRSVRSAQNTAGTNRIEVDLNGLPAGIYFLQLTDAVGGRAVRRVIKR
jgi:hypothetical protein